MLTFEQFLDELTALRQRMDDATAIRAVAHMQRCCAFALMTSAKVDPTEYRLLKVAQAGIRGMADEVEKILDSEDRN